MSKVISLRLNEENPREKRALAVLENRRDKGFSIRQTITEALITLEKGGNSVRGTNSLKELNSKIEQIYQLMWKGTTGQSVSEKMTMESSPANDLSSSFIESVRKASKPGRRLG